VARTLSVDLNRDRIHAVEAEPSPFETDESFAVELENHGRASHVHVHLDDALSRVASLDEGNRYVTKNGTEVVPVSVDQDGVGPVDGVLEVVTGYGAERVEIPVHVLEPVTPRVVDVDESLGEVHRRAEPDPLGERLRPAAPAGIAVVGLVCTVLAVLFSSDLVAVGVAVLAVVCAGGAWWTLD